MNFFGEVEYILNQQQSKIVSITDPMDGFDYLPTLGGMIRNVDKRMKKPIIVYGYYVSHASDTSYSSFLNPFRILG